LIVCFALTAQAEDLAAVQRAAEEGDAQAQFDLGAMYVKGNGVAKNYTEAEKWFRKAAEQGNAKAQSMVGAMYYDGQGGVAQDYTEAMKWYRKAAEQGLAQAQFTLGVMYDNNQGVAQNDAEADAEAVKWYRKAAEQGLVQAQRRLGYMYKYSKGVAQDYAEAVKWYRKAAEQGDANAQARLGSMYHEGKGVAQDHAEAMKWWRKAAEQGDSLGLQLFGLHHEDKDVVQNAADEIQWLPVPSSGETLYVGSARIPGIESFQMAFVCSKDKKEIGNLTIAIKGLKYVIRRGNMTHEGSVGRSQIKSNGIYPIHSPASNITIGEAKLTGLKLTNQRGTATVRYVRKVTIHSGGQGVGGLGEEEVLVPFPPASITFKATK